MLSSTCLIFIKLHLKLLYSMPICVGVNGRETSLPTATSAVHTSSLTAKEKKGKTKTTSTQRQKSSQDFVQSLHETIPKPKKSFKVSFYSSLLHLFQLEICYI